MPALPALSSVSCPFPLQAWAELPPAAATRRGSTVPRNSPDTLAPAWQTFFGHLGKEGFADLNLRNASLQRQIRDNGVTYNVYADADGPQRPWALDLFPLVLSPADWARIESDVMQRARLLENIMADVYGPQSLPRLGLLPAALVQGHPGYLRPMQGVKPPSGHFLHIAAFDLGRGPDGKWWVVSQRTQAPSGLGYLLENRLSISLQFPEAFRTMHVKRLAATYEALVDGLKAACASATGPGGGPPRIALLTPGPYNETYFEHAYLARYLGLTLVEGSDLMVRDNRLYLKTLKGLEPVHGLLKRLDDEFLDPVELRSDSTLGVPGLLQAIRAGNVLVANAPGSAFLESPAMLGFLPALCRHFLGEELSMPSLATWWCGEQAALQAVLPQLRECVIKPTYPTSTMPSVIGRSLSRAKLDEWAGRILRHGEDFTVQAYLPLSQAPTWQGRRIAPRSAMLRVFAVRDGQGQWRVLPGGLARLAGNSENIASMQHGGSSADVWALSGASDNLEVTPDSRVAPSFVSSPRSGQAVTSRAAENLFWLGRYTERAENSVRLAQLTLQSLSGENQTSQPLLSWLGAMAVDNALVTSSVPSALQARRVFERSLIASLGDATKAASVGYNLQALKHAASAVRERLSREQWQMVVRAEADFFSRCAKFSGPQHKGHEALEYSTLDALRALESASSFLAALTGAQTDRMMRDDGWRLLSIGRNLERLSTLASALSIGFETGAVFDEGGFQALVSLFDSTITFHAQYQQRRDVVALLDLLVLDRDNPRSLSWVVQTLRARLGKLADTEHGELADLARHLPVPGDWNLVELCGGAADTGPVSRFAGLIEQLGQCTVAALELSDLISRRYFSHATGASHSVGA
ncbi:MAG: circularly permuted type 2 ATP-grasp protein [Pseudomonadota bacterium]